MSWKATTLLALFSGSFRPLNGFNEVFGEEGSNSQHRGPRPRVLPIELSPSGGATEAQMGWSTGLEPVASRFTAWCSCHLSYYHRAPGRRRTGALTFRGRLLFQLSYRGETVS
jgi:hypothetical protein